MPRAKQPPPAPLAPPTREEIRNGIEAATVLIHGKTAERHAYLECRRWINVGAGYWREGSCGGEFRFSIAFRRQIAQDLHPWRHLLGDLRDRADKQAAEVLRRDRRTQLAGAADDDDDDDDIDL